MLAVVCRVPGAPSLRVFLRKGGIPRTSSLWILISLGAPGEPGRARVLLAPQIVREDTALQRLRCASDFVMRERIKTPKELTVESHPCKERKDGAPGWVWPGFSESLTQPQSGCRVPHPCASSCARVGFHEPQAF